MKSQREVRFWYKREEEKNTEGEKVVVLISFVVLVIITYIHT